MKLRNFIASIIAFVVLSTPALAADSPFHEGPVFKNFGKIATVDAHMPLSKQAEFKITLDVSKQSDVGKVNRTFNSAARFINMHVEAGVPRENIKLAIVVHGSASMDVTQNLLYSKKRDGATNANEALIEDLTKNGVEIYICGQSAAYHGIKKQDLLPGVKLSLSAMTAHVLLQQKGYALNPF